MKLRQLATIVLLLTACDARDEETTARERRPRSAEEPLVRTRRVDPPAIDGAIALSPVTAGAGVVATWIEPTTGDAHRVRFATLGPRGRWSAPSTVIESEELLASSVDFPIAARDASGNDYVTLLMRGRSPHASSIDLARSSNGSDWTVLGRLHDDATDTEHGHASLFLEDGAVRAVWLDGRAYVDGGPMAIRSATISDGAISDAALLDARVCDCCQTAGAALQGGTLVAYRDRSDTEQRDLSVVRRTADGWTPPSAVHEDGWTIEGCPVNGPQAAADGRRVALAWYTEASDRSRVRVAFSEDSGGRFGAPIDVDASRPFGRVDVEWTADGTALVSWIATGDERGSRVRLRHVAPDGRLGAPVDVAHTGAPRAYGAPRLARFGASFLIAWTEAGPPTQVRAAIVDPNDVPAPAGRPVAERAAANDGVMELGTSLPNATFVDLAGTAVSLSSLRGRPLVVSFFASWCAPCREELPLLSRVAREHADEIRVIGVSIDEASLADVARFARAEGLEYTVLHDRDGAASQFGVPPIPATFVFDARGTLAYRSGGGGAALANELPRAVAAVIGP